MSPQWVEQAFMPAVWISKKLALASEGEPVKVTPLSRYIRYNNRAIKKNFVSESNRFEMAFP